MTSNVASTTQIELTQRRQKLRQQRRTRSLQSIWRVLAVGGLASGSIWVATLPNWVIQRPEQITIEGNQLIPTEKIRARLTIPYPQSLLRLEPQAIAAALRSEMPLAEVNVSRKLFPPSLIVQVRERSPVAIAFLNAVDAQAKLSRQALQTKASKVGLLDESGIWISLDSYSILDESFKLPALKVIGRQEHYQTYWSQLFQDISRSPVKISEINLQNSANLILKTDLGTVHFGPYSSQFIYQLNVLDQMRRLPTRLASNQVAYIDLHNPEAPTVQVINAKDPVKSNTP